MKMDFFRADGKPPDQSSKSSKNRGHMRSGHPPGPEGDDRWAARSLQGLE